MALVSAWRPGLKTSMDFWGLVWKRPWKITFFGVKSGKDLRNCAAHPHQEFPGVPPSPWNCLLLTLIRPPKRPSAFFDAHCFQFLSSAATFPACSYTTWSPLALSRLSRRVIHYAHFVPDYQVSLAALRAHTGVSSVQKIYICLDQNTSKTAYKLIISTSKCIYIRWS